MDLSFIHMEEKGAAEKAGEVSKEKLPSQECRGVDYDMPRSGGEGNRVKEVKGKVSSRRGEPIVQRHYQKSTQSLCRIF